MNQVIQLTIIFTYFAYKKLNFVYDGFDQLDKYEGCLSELVPRNRFTGAYKPDLPTHTYTLALAQGKQFPRTTCQEVE